MRHQVWMSAVAASVAVVTLALAGCEATGSSAAKSGTDAPAGASGSAAPAEQAEIDEEEWFREVRLEDWTTHGGDTAVMHRVLHRIEQAAGKRENPEFFDTVIKPGPGNWITEWTAVAEKALGKADAAGSRGDSRSARDRYREASVYFTAAAYPQHRETQREGEAYQMAKDAYEKAAELSDWEFERLQVPMEGGTFEAFVHLPQGDGPFPVVITSGGIDWAKTEFVETFEEHLAPAGTAMISIDNAGFGDAQDVPADRPDMDRLYSAVVDKVSSDQRFDANRIAAMGQSYGGNTVGRLAFTDERVKAVVAVCPPVHEALNSGTDFIESLTPQPRAALAARYNVPVEDTERLAQIARKTSLVNQGFVGTRQTDTPILAMTTSDDPFATAGDMKRLAASTTDGEIKITKGTGHCPTAEVRNPIAADWLERHL